MWKDEIHAKQAWKKTAGKESTESQWTSVLLLILTAASGKGAGHVLDMHHSHLRGNLSSADRRSLISESMLSAYGV